MSVSVRLYSLIDAYKKVSPGAIHAISSTLKSTSKHSIYI